MGVSRLKLQTLKSGGTVIKIMRGISACIHQFDALDLGLSVGWDWGTWGSPSRSCMIEADRYRDFIGQGWRIFGEGFNEGVMSVNFAEKIINAGHNVWSRQTLRDDITYHMHFSGNKHHAQEFVKRIGYDKTDRNQVVCYGTAEEISQATLRSSPVKLMRYLLDALSMDNEETYPVLASAVFGVFYARPTSGSHCGYHSAMISCRSIQALQEIEKYKSKCCCASNNTRWNYWDCWRVPLHMLKALGSKHDKRLTTSLSSAYFDALRNCYIDKEKYLPQIILEYDPKFFERQDLRRQNPQCLISTRGCDFGRVLNKHERQLALGCDAHFPYIEGLSNILGRIPPHIIF